MVVTADAGVIGRTVSTGENLFGTAPVAVFAGGALGTLSAYFLEGAAGEAAFLPGEPFESLDRVDDFVYGPLLPISAAGLWLSGSLSGNGELENSGEQLSRGLLFTYGITGILKYSVGRARPDGSDNLSFPSYHTAGAFCAAAVLWDRFGAEAGIPIGVLALYTGMSRVNLGKHFPSDVIMGAAIGTACGIAASRVLDSDGESGNNFSVSFSVDTEGRITPGLW